MSHSPVTRPSLLLRVRTGEDQAAWHQFVEIYAPLIHQYGLHRGLQDADAADLAQEVLQTVSAAVRSFEYDPARGQFRGWLFTITLNKLRRMMTRRTNEERGSGDTAMQEVLAAQPADEPEDEFWTRTHKLRLFHWAAEQVRPEVQPATWQAFWQTSVENRPAAEVSAALGMSLGAVYIAKSRVLAKIREIVQSVEPE
jgi:RNA polymerase sigma-70 factor (ECF subfamily)